MNSPVLPQTPLIGLQAAMPLKDMATSTAAFILIRTLGGTIGIAVGQAIISSVRIPRPNMHNANPSSLPSAYTGIAQACGTHPEPHHRHLARGPDRDRQANPTYPGTSRSPPQFPQTETDGQPPAERRTAHRARARVHALDRHDMGRQHAPDRGRFPPRYVSSPLLSLSRCPTHPNSPCLFIFAVLFLRAYTLKRVVRTAGDEAAKPADAEAKVADPAAPVESTASTDDAGAEGTIQGEPSIYKDKEGADEKKERVEEA